MRRAIVFLACVLLVTACRRERRESPPVDEDGAKGAQRILEENNLYVTTAAETDERVRAVFPKGVASEDARARIGTAPPPPTDNDPDPSAAIVVALDLARPLDVATVRAAVTPPTGGVLCVVKGLTTGNAWQYVEDNGATGPYARVVVEISFVAIDAPESAADLDRAITWARNAFAKLDKRPPTISMTSAQAIAKAKAAFSVKQQLTDDVTDVGVVIVAPSGKKFSGRLVWDVVYSAGFRWGDGDYFHWVPSPDTDVSQGIGMGTSTGTSYFMPEWVAKNDGSADVDDLEMSFNVARTWQPDAVFGVMVRSADYMARRLGGTLMSPDGTPFDEAAARARVTSIVKSMSDAGLTPGASLALQVF